MTIRAPRCEKKSRTAGTFDAGIRTTMPKLIVGSTSSLLWSSSTVVMSRVVYAERWGADSPRVAGSLGPGVLSGPREPGMVGEFGALDSCRRHRAPWVNFSAIVSISETSPLVHLNVSYRRCDSRERQVERAF